MEEVDRTIVFSRPVSVRPPIVEPYEECVATADFVVEGVTASTALVRIVRCFGVKKSFLKLSVMGLPLAKIDLRILSKVHFPTSTGIPSKATKRAVFGEEKRELE